jgi:hypothetical protein
LPSPKDLVPQKHWGEKTTCFWKTTQPIRFVDSSNCAQISSEEFKIKIGPNQTIVSIFSQTFVSIFEQKLIIKQFQQS